MNLNEVTSKLKLEAGSLTLKAIDFEEGEIKSFLERFSDSELKIKNGVKEVNEDSSPKYLLLNGNYTGNWKIEGIDSGSYSFVSTKLRITEETGGHNKIFFSVEGKIKLDGIEAPTLTEFAEKKNLKCSVDVSCAAVRDKLFKLADLYQIGNSAKSFLTLPENIGVINKLALNKFELEFDPKGEKESTISALTKSSLNWKLLSNPVELILEDVFSGYHITHHKMKKNINSFQYIGYIGGKISLQAGDSSEKFSVKIYIIPGGEWKLKIIASEQKKFPQIETICAIIGKRELAKSITDFLGILKIKALDISSLEISYDAFASEITSVQIGCHLVIGEVQLNSTLLLPGISLMGRLGSSGDSKEPLVKINARDFLRNMNLPGAMDFPEISINSIQFFASPLESAYSIDINLSGSWPFNEIIKLENLDLMMYYANGQLSCSSRGELQLFNKFNFAVYTEIKTGDEGGWTFEGNTEPEQEIGLDVLAEDILRTFNVTLPFNLPEIKIKNVEVKFDSAKKYFLLSATMTEFSLEKLHITGIPLIDGIIVKNVVLYLKIENGGTPEGSITGEIVVDGTVFCIKFERTNEEINFKGAIKNLTMDIKEIGKKLVPNLESLVAIPISKIKFSQIAVEYHSKQKLFTFAIDIENKLSYDFNTGTTASKDSLSKIELDNVKFILAASNTSIAGALSCTLAIGNSAKLNFIVKLSNNGFYLKGELAQNMVIDLPVIAEYFLGKNVKSIFNGVPQEYQKLVFNKLSLIIDTYKGTASFEADTENFGGIKFALLRSKEGTLGFALAIVPPSSFKFSGVHKSLEILDGINISGTCLIISSIEQPKLPWEDLQGAIKENKVVQGLNLFASMNLKDTNLHLAGKAGEVSKIANELGKLIKIQNLTIHGAIGVSPTSILIEGYIGEFSIYDSKLKLENAGLRLSADGIFAVYGTLALNFNGLKDKMLSMRLIGVVKLQANGIEISAIWTGDFGTEQLRDLAEACKDITKAIPPGTFEKINQSVIKQIAPNLPDKTLENLAGAGYEVLGTLSEVGKIGEKVLDVLPGIQIKEVGLVLGCDWECVPTGGCVGRFTLNGDQPENEGLVAFLFNSNNPLQSLLQIKFPKDAQQTIIKFLDRCNELISVPQERPGWTPLIEVNGYDYEGKWTPLQVKIAPCDVTIGNIIYTQGIIIQGRVVIFSYLDIILNIILDFRTGIKAFGRMKPILIKKGEKEIIEITGISNPILPANKLFKENIENVPSIYNGPLFNLSIPIPFDPLNLPNMKFSGKVKFLGFEVIKIDCEISENDVHFTFSGSNDYAKYSLDCRLVKINSLTAEGNLFFDSHIILERPLYDTSNLPIPIIEMFDGYVELTVNDLKCLLTIEISFKVMNPATGEVKLFRVSRKTFDVVKTFQEIIDWVVNAIRVKIILAFEAVCKSLNYEIEKIKNLINQLVENTVKELEREIELLDAELNLLADEIKKILDSIGLNHQFLDEMIKQLGDVTHASAEIGYQIARMNTELQQAVNNLENLVANCFLGVTEEIILAVEAGTKAAYWTAENNRISAYNERITWSPLINWAPSLKEIYWADQAAKLYLPMIAAQNAVAPIKEARKAVNWIHDRLNELLMWERQKLDETKELENRMFERRNEKAHYESYLIEKRTLQSSKGSLLNEKRESLDSANNKVAELKQKKINLTESARTDIVSLMKLEFDKIAVNL